MSWSIIDFQGFKSNENEFIIKELFILKDDDSSYSYLFKPPFSKDKLSSKAKRTNHYCTKYIHGLKWDAGEVPYRDLMQILRSICKDDIHIMCKGSEKTSFLKKILNPDTVLDLDLVLFKRLNVLEENSDGTSGSGSSSWCPYNHHGFSCAKKNCFKILNWWKKFKNIL